MMKFKIMKQLFLISRLTLFLFVLILFSCGEEQTQKQEKNTVKEKSKTVNSLSDEEKYRQKMAAIDSNKQLKVFNGLSFNNEAGETVQAIGYVDINDQEVKIEELFSDPKTGNYGTNYFYIEAGKKFASKQIIYDNTKKPTVFVERVSYFNEKQEVIYTKERTAEYEELLGQAGFKPATLFDCEIDRAMRALNEEGEFETTFQGFIQYENLDYILVGANTKTGYVSSLAVILPNELINMLKSDERKYVGTPLEVQFQKDIGGSGMTYQALVDIRLK